MDVLGIVRKIDRVAEVEADRVELARVRTNAETKARIAMQRKISGMVGTTNLANE